MLDRLTSMAAFVKAAELGSFTAAGTALGMTSQMVGKHVAALEQRLGTSLLQRTTRRQRLTETGQMFYDRCRAVLAEADMADALIEDEAPHPSGRLRLSAPIGFGATRLAPAIAAFMSDHPAIEVELILTDRYVDLVNEGFDATLRLGPLDRTSFVAIELAVHDQVACAAPAYLSLHGEPRTPAELAKHACLGYVNWSGRPYAEWRFARDGVIQPVTVRPRFRVNDGRVLVAAAVAGHGVILQPRAVAADALASGTLVPVLADYTPPSRPLFLVYPRREPTPRKLEVLIEHVVRSFHVPEAPTMTRTYPGLADA